MNKRNYLLVDVMSGKPDRDSKIITYVLGMPHAKFDCFEIRVCVLPYLITIDQREMLIV
jgi:hypothetical protein